MLGMPETDSNQLRKWSSVLVRSLEPVNDPEIMKAIAEAGEGMFAFTQDVIQWKRREPGADLLSALIAAEDAGDMLSDDELVDQVILLYVAGHETTVSLIGNGALALLNNRDQLEQLRADPALDGNAVEELLRYDPPVQMTRRITLTDAEVGGKIIPERTFVVCVIASANRDVGYWGVGADRVDLARDNAHTHLSFGGGVHYCLGAALARLEAQVAIGSLIRRFPKLEMVADPTWNGRLNLRGLEKLPLSVG
jgi:cytochrome P450